MLTVEIDFLASRFGATAFDDRSSAEWPPHPARLFSAMVAAWADSSAPDGDEEAALRWFEALEPPSIRCAGESEISRRSIVTHYVPVNDCRVTTRDVSGLYDQLRRAQSDVESATDDRAVARASKALARTAVNVRRDSRVVGAAGGDVSPTVRDGALAVLPDLRGRQGRTFPVIRLSEAVSAVRFRWASAEPGRAVADALDRVLGRVGRLGHSSTPVSCRLSTGGSDEGGDTLVTWQVMGEGDTSGEGDPPVMVRVPAPGLFDRLAVQFAEDGGSRPRVAPARFVPYRPSSRATVTPATSLLAGSWRVLAIRRGGRVRLTRTLDLSRAVRGALLSGCDDAPPYVLHGHTPGAPGTRTAPGLQPHLSILPLANVGSRFGDGVVHGVALVLPRRASSEDRDAVDKAVRRWRTRGQDGVMPLRMHNLAVELEDRGFDSTAQGDPVQTT
ncbi:MAG: type I-G CRISPR-associated protein Csb2, partial [Acidimicrobiales bacterium]